MNNKDDYCIKLLENIELKAVREAVRHRVGKSFAAMGIYCSARTASLGAQAMLCVFLGKSRSVADEQFLPAKLFETSPSSIAEAVLKFAAEYAYNEVIIAIHRNALTEPESRFCYYSAAAIFIKDFLRERGIKLCGFYLTEGAAFENILPKADITDEKNM